MKFENGYTTVKRTESCDELQRRETNDCVVRAIANASGCTYSKAHSLAAKHYQRGFRMGTRTMRILNNSRELFAELKLETNNVSFSQFWESKQKREFGTINQFVKNNPTGRHFLLVRGHALAVVDGVVYDNAGRTSGRHRVEIAFSLGSVKAKRKPQASGRRSVRFTISKNGVTHADLTPKQVWSIVGGNLASVQSICAKRRPQVYGWTLTFE